MLSRDSLLHSSHCACISEKSIQNEKKRNENENENNNNETNSPSGCSCVYASSPSLSTLYFHVTCYYCSDYCCCCCRCLFLCFARLVYWRRAGFLLLISVFCILSIYTHNLCVCVCLRFSKHFYPFICTPVAREERQSRMKNSQQQTKKKQQQKLTQQTHTICCSFGTSTKVVHAIEQRIGLIRSCSQCRLPSIAVIMFCISFEANTKDTSHSMFILYVDRLLLYYV